MIHPTPGRVVWFYPGSMTGICKASNDDPLAAIVARVWSDRMVNLCVFDANGTPMSQTSVKLLQDDDKPDFEGQHHAAWMPYQVGQAAKAAGVSA